MGHTGRMDKVAALAFGAFYGLIALLLLGWPLYSVWRLALRVLRGTPLPSGGIFGLYIGGFPWTLVVWYQGALHPELKFLLVVPFAVCGLLAAVWGKLMVPPRSGASSTGDMFALWFMGLMSLVTCGGGYFDKMVVVAEAANRLNKAGISREDPAALARAMDHEDPWVRYGAALALQNSDAATEPARDALTWALVDPDERVSSVGARVFYDHDGKGPTPSPAVLGPLLDSGDEASRTRAQKAVEKLSAAGKTAALDEVSRWRAERSAAASLSVYYAHPLSLYDKPEEAADVEALKKAGYRVDNPNDPAVEARFQATKDFAVFTALAASADAVAVRAFPDGKLGAGVAKEALAGLERGKRVFELRGGAEPFHPLTADEVRSRALTVEQTRDALKRYGVVKRIKY